MLGQVTSKNLGVLLFSRPPASQGLSVPNDATPHCHNMEVQVGGHHHQQSRSAATALIFRSDGNQPPT